MEPYIYDLPTETGFGDGLEISYLFADSTVFNNSSIFLFYG